MAMRVTTTLISMVFIRVPKRCQGMTMWIKMLKRKVKKNKVVKEELILKRRL
jgi:hypothetical protein